MVLVSGYVSVTMGAWQTKDVVTNLPKPFMNAYGTAATPAGSSVFCSVYANDGTLRIESKDSAISNNVFFSIVYTSI